MGNFMNDKYDDDNGLFYYEEGYNDDIYYYEKGDFFNGKFKEGKKIEGKIYDKNSQLKFAGSFQNDIPIINISDNNNNDSNKNNCDDKDNNYDIYKGYNNNENNRYEDFKDNDYNENNSDIYEKAYNIGFGNNIKEIEKNNNINPIRNINNNISNNNNNSAKNENNNGKKKGNLINGVKKFIYNHVDGIKNYIPIPIGCRACRHDIKKHIKIGNAEWICSECVGNNTCYVE